MKYLVQELTNVPPDLLGLAGDVPTDDGDEPWAEGVVEDQPQADNTTCGHDLELHKVEFQQKKKDKEANLSTVLYEIDQGRQKKLQESINLNKQLFRIEKYLGRIY